MAKSGGSAGVQRKLRGIGVGMVTYDRGKYTVHAKGAGAEMSASGALNRAGYNVSIHKLSEYSLNGWYELTARKRGR